MIRGELLTVGFLSEFLRQNCCARADQGAHMPTFPPTYRITEHKDFCVCRVLQDCALIRITSTDQLSAARKFMRRIAARVPGSYLVFSKRSGRVLGKMVYRA